MTIAARILIAPIRLYQRFISPALPATCRYYPTCSAYAVEALQVHGALRGSWLAIRRLGRCHPWHEGGVDHVPPRRERSAGSGSSLTGPDFSSGIGPGISSASQFSSSPSVHSYVARQVPAASTTGSPAA